MVLATIILNLFFVVVQLGIIYLVRTQKYLQTNISYPLIRTRTCAYQEERDVIISENFGYVLNGWSLIVSCSLTF